MGLSGSASRFGPGRSLLLSRAGEIRKCRRICRQRFNRHAARRCRMHRAV